MSQKLISNLSILYKFLSENDIKPEHSNNTLFECCYDVETVNLKQRIDCYVGLSFNKENGAELIVYKDLRSDVFPTKFNALIHDMDLDCGVLIIEGIDLLNKIIGKYTVMFEVYNKVE